MTTGKNTQWWSSTIENDASCLSNGDGMPGDDWWLLVWVYKILQVHDEIIKAVHVVCYTTMWFQTCIRIVLLTR